MLYFFYVIANNNNAIFSTSINAALNFISNNSYAVRNITCITNNL